MDSLAGWGFSSSSQLRSGVFFWCYRGIAYILYRVQLIIGPIMVDPGFIPGLIGVGIQMTINKILRHINIALRYRKELAALKDTLRRIKPFIEQIRPALNEHEDGSSAVHNWFKEFDTLLKEASAIVQLCIRKKAWGVPFRYQTSTKIIELTQKIDKLLTQSGLVITVQIQELTRKFNEIEALASSSSSASTFQATHSPIATINSKKGDKTVTGTVSRLSDLSKVSSFQDQQLDSRDFVSHDVEEEDHSGNQRSGKALYDFPAEWDDELNLTAGEEVEILDELAECFFVIKKQPGRYSKVAGWVPVFAVSSSYSSFSMATTRYLQGPVSHDVKEEEGLTENQLFGKALYDFSAEWDDELNLMAGEEVKILDEQAQRFYVIKKQSGRDSEVAGWVPVFAVSSSYSSFSVATTRYLQEDKPVTGTASGLSNLSKVSSFEDQQPDSHGLVSHDAEEQEVPTKNQRLSKALYDFPAGSEDELNLTAGEEVEILGEQAGWFYASKKQPGRDSEVAGWVPVFYVSSPYSSF